MMTPSMFNFDLNKMMSDFRIPGMDLEFMMASQRKNIEAFTKANHLALEGIQAVARRQAEIMRGGFEHATSAMREVMAQPSVTDRATLQTEMAKRSVETAISNARELTELFTKAQSEAFEVLNKRMCESFDEVKDFAKH